ncbi:MULTISPECIES: SDR family NAD(P)-dependent oxidoreductase [unclassified Novosphingobium]|uniref:SDR family NAD(P)-dependent oxidoreductase n=1 Tax=unclassified Novosphingobium TaxID=2644732 RepID=UPI00086BA422|nr:MULTISPECIES: SDR family oxidoreductase [unclassified Novosphingobium]MBN9142292.1 SDR family oxidoreductase [Novosphingobium sp.]MDR6710319.1 NAD(P)-dependent dehydrogenase (short-subunit alcohol dehydrogenase family) [Novosphingobium sp. 1748]ODU78590.1 MAG: 3-oxoacyl-ACP reductase [Novosphingobium sp. SCN 63-17]OJX90521.1 MAG: 3-oxoacyl-ACP reductase [Novosphingobium sp. 63-713]
MSAVNNGRAIYPSLAGKRVFISGGASGIGEGFVEAFVAQGAKVAFCDIAEEAGKAVAARLNTGANPAPVFFPCDLTDMAAVQAMMAQVEETLGGIDVVINNAANDDRHSVAEVTPAYWDERMAVNLRHQFFVAQAAVPSMKRAGGGAIINLGSISWHLGLEDLVVYQTAKAAIEGMTRGLARELGRDNIRVTSIIPGNVKTPRQERWYTPEGEAEIVAAQCLDGRLLPYDVAALALFLASDDARLITGHEYWVDAGWR